MNYPLEFFDELLQQILNDSYEQNRKKPEASKLLDSIKKEQHSVMLKINRVMLSPELLKNSKAYIATLQVSITAMADAFS